MKTYLIKKRWLVKGEGWKHESYEVEGTLESAWREASGAAHALDERYRDSTGWDWWVNLCSDKGEDIVELFRGRLS